jgi:heme oxygenase
MIPMILQRLKRDTASQHEQIERRIDLLARMSSRAMYRVVLMQFYGLYVPVEAALDQVDGLPLVLGDLAARWKTDLIARDLAALGVSASEILALPRCTALPALTDVAHALGCLYVIEGSTLGRQVITRLIASELGITVDGGGAFFHSYGAMTGPMWRSFGAGLAAYATTPEREALIVASAQETFGAFERWLAGEESVTQV